MNKFETPNLEPATDQFFYAPPECFTGNEIILLTDEAEHIAKVLRKVAGDDITIVDGNGNAFPAKLTHVARNNVRAHWSEKISELNESKRDVTLCVGLIKNPSRFEFLIEKATELGVRTIVPLITERTIHRTIKRERWEHLAIAAMKQSLRCRAPRISEPMSLEDSFVQIKRELNILCHEEMPDEPTPRKLIAEFAPASCAVWIGPEGGFSPEEISLARSLGIRFASLGARRLRTETAGIAALASVLIDS